MGRRQITGPRFRSVGGSAKGTWIRAGRVVMVLAVVAILGAALVPADASADTGSGHRSVTAEHRGGKTIPLGILWLYMAYDTGHPLPCKYFAKNNRHFNFNLKWKANDPDRKAILRLHMSPPNNNRFAVYEANSRICAQTNWKGLPAKLSKMLKSVGGRAQVVVKRLLGVLAGAMKLFACRGKC